jgi:hypothetical protein
MSDRTELIQRLKACAANTRTRKNIHAPVTADLLDEAAQALALTEADGPRWPPCGEPDDRQNSPNPMVHCDRRRGHLGLHSWHLSAPPDGEAKCPNTDGWRKCILKAGHKGDHVDDFYSWPAADAAPAQE